MKYHINTVTGRVNICRADKKPCPLGENTPHFTDKEKAKTAAEKMLSSQFGNVSSKKKKKIVPNYYGMSKVAYKRAGKLWEDYKETQEGLHRLIRRNGMLKHNKEVSDSISIKDEMDYSERKDVLVEIYKAANGPYFDSKDLKNMQNINGNVPVKEIKERLDGVIEQNARELRSNERAVENVRNRIAEIHQEMRDFEIPRENPRFGIPTDNVVESLELKDQDNLYYERPQNSGVVVLENAETFCVNCNITLNENFRHSDTNDARCENSNSKYATANEICMICGTGDPSLVHSDYESDGSGTKVSCNRCGGSVSYNY